MTLNLRKSYPHLWQFFSKKKLSVFSTCFVLLGQAGLVIFLPLPVGFIFDKIIKNSPDKIHDVVLKGLNFGQMETMQALTFLCILGFSAALFLIAFEWLEQMITTQTTYNLNVEVRTDLFRRIFTAKQSWLDSRKKVDIMGRVSGDVSNLEVLFVTGIRAVVNSVPTIVFMLIMMFSINTQFTLRFCLALPVFVFLINFFAGLLRKETKILRRTTVRFETETHEAVSALPVLKSFSGDVKIMTKMLTGTKDVNRASERVRNAGVGLDISASAAYHVIRAILIFLGSVWVFNGKITTGDLIIFMSYMGSFMKPVNDIIKFTSRLPKCIASMDRLEEIFTELENSPEQSGQLTPNLDPAKIKKQILRFQDVSFRYPQGKSLFKDFAVEFDQHALVGIVGQSGNGKSTFSRLINRLHDPDTGSILLDGKDLREFDLQSLRRTVRVLSQDPFLVAGTVRENLLLASSEDLPDSILEEALESVNALEFVRALPKGLDTEVGDGGQQLSGGQSKRIHLARAFMNIEASIFVFDEPTTGLDSITSSKVIESVRTLAQRKHLVFWITHRMEEIPLCSSILFFSPNTNPVHSTHEILCAESEPYRALVAQETAQSSPLLKKEDIERLLMNDVAAVSV